MYAGNVGLSQSLELLIDAARATADRDDVVYVVNGGGSTLGELRAAAHGLPNVRFAPMQPVERLPEVLAAADVHVVPLKRGLSRSSVPSKTYSILAAGRPVLASVDQGSEVQRLVESAGAGIAVPPEEPAAFVAALRRLLDDPAQRAAMSASGRAFVEQAATPRQVAEEYDALFCSLTAAPIGRRGRRGRRGRQRPARPARPARRSPAARARPRRVSLKEFLS